MSVLALPLAISIAVWEGKKTEIQDRKALNWARGAMAYAGGPYLSHRPRSLAKCPSDLVCGITGRLILSSFRNW